VSSILVRQVFKDFVQANIGTEKLVDLTAEYRDLKDVLAAYAIGPLESFTAISFVGNEDSAITIGSNNVQGKYREMGAVYIYFVATARLGVSDAILLRAETFRKKIRGLRLGSSQDVLIDSVTPPNFDTGVGFQFESGFIAATLICTYEYDEDF
jgi:hypothetical protein